MCLPEKRKEVAEAKEKMEGYNRSAKERFVTLMAKLEGSTKPVHSSSFPSSSNARVASPARRGARVNRVPPSRSGNSGTLIPSRDQLLKGVDAKLGERLLDEMLDRTGVKLSDVIGCDAAKEALEEAVILPALNPALFSGLRQPVKGILLFGPPGNGKTLLAKAVASESNQVFFNISAASLTSKWVGESEKTIRSLFQIAKNAQPAIIFIDEIDSILCDRSEKDTEVSRRMKTEFLLQFDGATSSPDDRILVIGATNRPYELDDAVLRRFPKRIYLGLPDRRSRSTLLKAILDKHNMSAGLTDYDIGTIASKTEGYSNSDLVALCKEAAMVPIRSIDREKLATCDGSKLRKLKCSDFDKALMVIRPSSNDRSLQSLFDFGRRAGQI
ncbi:protein hexamerization [Parelaphostrongylus tenuis]|uniref:microtubule-severing ATPase n=1 Tax=Parelaphostrongylus tenuis TaxID=148309 RepID=A0AAD5WJF2_PARTN|nr:protein hexamerization [Parelaphostrongylus tenuis]